MARYNPLEWVTDPQSCAHFALFLMEYRLGFCRLLVDKHARLIRKPPSRFCIPLAPASIRFHQCQAPNKQLQ